MTDYYEPTDVTLEERGTVTVEAPSVEAALEAVARQFGESARIVKAEKVTKGGIGGFFGKETYQITVAESPGRPDPAPGERTVLDPGGEATDPGGAASRGPATQGALDSAAAVDLVLERIEAGESAHRGTFGDALKAELRARSREDGPTAGISTPETIDLRDGASGLGTPAPVADPAGHMPWTRPLPAPPTAPTDTGSAVDGEIEAEPPIMRSPRLASPSVAPVDTRTGATPEVTYSPPTDSSSRSETERPLGWPSDGWQVGTGPVDWSMDRLARLGLPYSWLSRVDGLDPLDDMAWVHRLARIGTEVCGPFPSGDQLTVGLDTRGVAGVFGLPSAVFPGVPSFEGDLAVSLLSPSQTALDWLDRIRAKRWIHLVVDSTLPAPTAAQLDPAVVSWVDGAMTQALELVSAGNAVLGYRFRSDGHAVRVSPFELALSIRELLPRR
ncbi:MAG TPA: hypothetical protein ENI86_02990 [Acidimicrobiales bacterium]|nr:hypothetical protein [Acidimicrobiales bacterium]